MGAPETAGNTLRLVYAAGPSTMEPIELSDARSYVLGRSSGCEVVLDDPGASISRSHLRLACTAGRWTVTDLGSSNGTQVNGSAITPHQAVELEHGDNLRLGSWSFQVLLGGGPDARRVQEGGSTLVHTLCDTGAATHLIERVAHQPLASLASDRLAILLECSDRINRVTEIERGAGVALEAMVRSTGYTRAAYIVPLDETGVYETVAFRSAHATEDVSAVNFSQSLLEMAAKGEVVRLSASGRQADYGQSIADLGIHSALCVPVMVDGRPVGYLYLDARGDEGKVGVDASAFGRAIGRLLGLTAANLRNRALEMEQLAMEFDLNAAASAQRLLLPPETGRVGAVAYSMSMRPGRMVAGDLFGVVELDAGRVCVFLGDVSGKGAGAAIMMATTQSYLHAMLEQSSDLGVVMGRLNRHIAQRSTGRFVTMWIGIITPASDGGGGEIEFVDAGHGHWLVTNPGQDATRPAYRGGLVVGIDPGHGYRAEKLTLGADQRLVLFSDGVVEQTCPVSDEEFGLARTGSLLRSSDSQSSDVRMLMDQVVGFARSSSLKDDTTIASIRVIPPESGNQR